MKKFYLIFLALVLVKVAGSQWVKQSSGTTANLNSVCFLDSQTGFIVGKGGTILKTLDGGIQWVQQTSGVSSILTSVFFLNSDTGYAVGRNWFSTDSAVILKTVNGGNLWTRLSAGGSYTNLYSVWFTDANTGYAVGNKGGIGLILKTANGGASWTRLNFPDFYLGFNSVRFLTPAIGVLAADDGSLLKTIDGGLTWTTQANFWYPLYSTSFVDSGTGYAVGGEPAEHPYASTYGWVYSTTDSGTSWSLKYSGYSCFHSVCFPAPDTGYVAGWFVAYQGAGNYSGGATIRKTTDGGITWDDQDPLTTQWLNSVYFTNTKTGYIAGDSGIILKTTNGGVYTGAADLPSPTRSLIIYPNPASLGISIESPEYSTGDQLSILDVTGLELIKVPLTDRLIHIDIEALPAGVYLAKVTGKRTALVGKFVKE